MGVVVGAGMPDVERLTRKLERRKASLSDLCQLYRASSKLPLIQNALLDHPGPHAHLLKSRLVCGMSFLVVSCHVISCYNVSYHVIFSHSLSHLAV